MSSGTSLLIALFFLFALVILSILFSSLGEFFKNTFHGGNEVKKDAERLNKEKADFELEKLNFENKKIDYQSGIESLKEKEKEIDNKLKILSHKSSIIDETMQSHPEYATLLMRYDQAIDNYRIARLSQRAYRAKEVVNEIKNEKKQLVVEKEMYFSQLLMYETLFPWLEEFKEIPIDEAKAYVQSFDNADTDEREYFKNWLSPEEFSKLSMTEKLQRKLDKWKNRPKSDWEAGIEYERCIGYLYEQSGYTVNYSGALNGFDDMGRDLIAVKGNSAVIIQCKRWKKDKLIHEKHIFQLFGTSVLYELQSPTKKVTSAFITTGALSDTAKQCADRLKIKVVNQNMIDYPLIKCNINLTTGEKIYHLPFDQQYDRVVIDPQKGECYVFTVADAEARGFRHALRHFSD